MSKSNNALKRFNTLIADLESAIREKQKREILSLYDAINAIEFANIPEDRLEYFEKLIDLGNEILGY